MKNVVINGMAFDPTALDDVSANAKAIKILRDGQLLILRDGKSYNALGLQK
ncbi:MAG: hypothetical protein J6W92_00195 [Paludibacteraceae bacterium]|nr:hypothetical protein [Paludibacteraceae bacterium]